MKSFRHWTPHYVFWRLVNIASQRLHPERPWLTARAIRFLELWLGPSNRVFERGTGRSTLWFAKRVQQVISVDHDPAWHRRIAELARRKGAENIEFRLHLDGPSLSPDSSYVSAIDKVPGEFDLILIDGVSRDQCSLRAIPRLKAGGLLIVDNANWYLPSRSCSPTSRSLGSGPASPNWRKFALQVSGWRVIWTTNGVWDTAIWIRPAALELSATLDRAGEPVENLSVVTLPQRNAFIE